MKANASTSTVLAFLLLTSTTLAGGFPPPPALGRFPPPPKLVSVEVEKPNVQLLLFSAEWCEACKPAHANVKELKARGWEVKEYDIDKQKDDPWVTYNRTNYEPGIPHWIILVDGKPWEDFRAARNVPYIEDMLQRAQNIWRRRHGIEPIPFKAYGDTTNPDPINREFFYREHWRLSPGTCGMLGCTVHGGGLVKAVEKVPVQPVAEQARPNSSQPETRGAPVRIQTRGRSCPFCR